MDSRPLRPVVAQSESGGVPGSEGSGDALRSREPALRPMGPEPGEARDRRAGDGPRPAARTRRRRVHALERRDREQLPGGDDGAELGSGPPAGGDGARAGDALHRAPHAQQGGKLSERESRARSRDRRLSRRCARPRESDRTQHDHDRGLRATLQPRTHRSGPGHRRAGAAAEPVAARGRVRGRLPRAIPPEARTRAARVRLLGPRCHLDLRRPPQVRLHAPRRLDVQPARRVAAAASAVRLSRVALRALSQRHLCRLATHPAPSPPRGP